MFLGVSKQTLNWVLKNHSTFFLIKKIIIISVLGTPIVQARNSVPKEGMNPGKIIIISHFLFSQGCDNCSQRSCKSPRRSLEPSAVTLFDNFLPGMRTCLTLVVHNLV